VSELLRQSLVPVLRDVRTSRMPEPDVRDGDWIEEPGFTSAWLCDAGNRIGIRLRVAASEAERIAEVADQVQDWVIDELMGTSATNWPPCPTHPESHPLEVSTREHVAVWICPVDRTPISQIGALA
jgi:hypothetical protein